MRIKNSRGKSRFFNKVAGRARMGEWQFETGSEVKTVLAIHLTYANQQPPHT
jgi:hypothetical protein